MTAGIIIAKGSSSRLPGKNMMDFCGHPLTAWSIIHSKNSVLIDETYVSTDSNEIADMGRKYGAQIIWRDYEEEEKVPANIPFCHAIRKLKAEKELDMIVPLLPTSPTRLPDDLDNIIRLKKKRNVREVGSLTPHQEAMEYEIIDKNIAKLVFWDKTGKYVTQGCSMSAIDIDYYLESADISVDAWSMEEALELQSKNTATGMFLFREISYYPTKIWQQFDIDYQDEFELIQVLMEHYILKGKGIEIYEEYRKREEKRMAINQYWTPG